MDIDLTEVEPEKIGKGGEFFPVGKFHVQVNSLEEWAGKNNDSTLVQFQCLTSNLPDMAGAQHNEYFAMTPKAVGRLLQLAIACRLTTREQLKKWKDAGERASIDWQQIVGRQCLVVTEEDEYNGKLRAKINYNIFDVDDRSQASIPKDAAMLSRFQQMCPSPNGQAAVAPTAQPDTQQSAGSDDLFS